MGLLEVKSRARTRRYELRKIILESVKFAGILSDALLAPSVLGTMKRLSMIPSPRQHDVVRRASERMIRAGFLEWRNRRIRLTQKGELALRTLTIRDYKIPRPRRWDGKWRVLIFDIPERRKGLRERIRHVLQMIGFIRLQDSVWAYPYDCEDLITLLKADSHVGDDVLYMIVDAIERDSSLRRHFKLV